MFIPTTALEIWSETYPLRGLTLQAEAEDTRPSWTTFVGLLYALALDVGSKSLGQFVFLCFMRFFFPLFPLPPIVSRLALVAEFSLVEEARCWRSQGGGRFWAVWSVVGGVGGCLTGLGSGWAVVG